MGTYLEPLTSEQWHDITSPEQAKVRLSDLANEGDWQTAAYIAEYLMWGSDAQETAALWAGELTLSPGPFFTHNRQFEIETLIEIIEDLS